jgi:DNA repair exonuclease SbcCD ATPase subunit
MNKTKVDDMLIEMIKPKITEIEKKFSNNEALSQDDINTLLLKSQYNHINHLDEKLNEVTQSVKNLEHKFDMTVVTLKNDYEKLEQKVDNNIQSLQINYKKLEQKFDNTVKELKNDFDNTVKALRNDYEKLEQKIEATIQKALNKNMMLLIIVIGLFMTLSKLIDKLF